MRWFYIIAIAVVAVLTLSPLVFLAGDMKEQHPEGVLSWNTYASAVKSIDPATAGDVTSAGIQANFYESLYAYHYLKRPLEVEPQLADGMPEVSADGLVYTIRIKPGVRFHRNACFGPDPTGAHQWNTRTVTAHDFVLACKRIADYHINTGLAWAFLADRIAGLDAFRERTRQYKSGDFSRYDLPVEGLEAVDSLTLRLTLTTPFPQLVYVLAMSVYAPVPREVIDYWLTSAPTPEGGRRTIPDHERNPEIMQPEQVVGTGPYLLDTWKRKWKITLRRNPEFREEYYPCEGEPGDSAAGLLVDCGKRVPFIDHVQFRFIEEDYANFMLFLGKQLDAGGIPRETFDNIVSPDKQLTDQWRNRQIALRTYTEPSVFWIVYNMEDKVLGASKALRQAICLG
jgi:oligopeptide transport system substrate-binding protein